MCTDIKNSTVIHQSNFSEMFEIYPLVSKPCHGATQTSACATPKAHESDMQAWGKVSVLPLSKCR